MSYQALYRKYRPQTFSDVVGQEHITETLKSELSSGKIVHAYLFTGTRGTGKTSCAKILANAVNCFNSDNGDPCLECESCKAILEDRNTDIVEMDAASNRGIDDIRILRERISFAPSVSKYRVYIIDEVHMLTTEAFNALLKTLEEPPKHVIFILATTEVHKLPATILSRCQRFDFRRIDNAKICERLQFVAESEGLTLTDSAATLIASAADGGMRDALSILDLCASASKNIDEQTVESVCAMAGNDYLLELADFIKQRDTENSLLMLEKLHNSSVDMLRLLGELISHFRDLMIVKTVKSDKKPIVCTASHLEKLKTQADGFDIKDIMYTLNILQGATLLMQTGNRRCEMEMAIIKLCNPSFSADLQSLERRIAALEDGVVPVKAKKAKVEIEPESVEEISQAEEIEEMQQEPQIQEFSDQLSQVEKWGEIVTILKTTCPLIAGVLDNSKAYTKGPYLLIDATNSQFRTMIKNSNTYKDAIRKAAEKVLGKTYKLGPYTKQAVSENEDPLLAIANKLKQFETN